MAVEILFWYNCCTVCRGKWTETRNRSFELCVFDMTLKNAKKIRQQLRTCSYTIYFPVSNALTGYLCCEIILVYENLLWELHYWRHCTDFVTNSMARDSQMHCLDKRYDHNFSSYRHSYRERELTWNIESSNVFQS